MQTETTTIERNPKRLTYIVQEAISVEQLNEVYKLRYKVYVEDNKYFNKAAFSDEKLNDKFDTQNGTLNLLVCNSENCIGTIRVTIIENREQEFPCDHYHEEYKKLRSKLKGKFASVSMLAIKKQDCSVQLLYSLIKEAIKIGSANRVDYALFPANYILQPTLERLGAILVGETKYNEHVGTYVAPMMLEVKKMAQRFAIKGYYC
ncbi:MAG: GNAT family N-acetyltransferase [Bacteroidetes bacterium]|nr:GNAT family N-acetyltransferase [Bacteroidota bacterium]